MELLVLGGTGFVGPAVVEDALARGWSVTTFNRGSRPGPLADVEPLRGDRLSEADLSVLAGRSFDLVVDTWSGAPRAVAASAALLSESAERYAYVSS